MSAAHPSMVSGSTKEFPPFRLDTVNECLWRHRDDEDDERIRLTPKAFAVLRYLVEHAGRLVRKNEILDAAWPDTFVQPEVLKSQILDIRRLLSDDPKNPRFIETLPKRGYQFIAPIREASALADPPVELRSSGIIGRDRQLDELRNCLKDVLIVDREAIKLLATRASNGGELRNCPAYIREWVTREMADLNASEERTNRTEGMGDA